MEIREEIRKYALQNAVRYGKLPKVEAVMKKILGEHPEWRREAKGIVMMLREEIERIGSMSREEWRRELAEIAPEMIEEGKREERGGEGGLPELPFASSGGVVMRFAPNPNGAATLGSARGIVINSEYAKIYKGKFILRFDDTDPALKKPLLEAYDWYIEDCEWLDAKPDEVVVASERIDIYYKYARGLIERGGAYVCFCEREVFKGYKEKKRECPHRNTDIETNLEFWERMLGGEYEEKEAVLRIKTGMALEDPALRDWVAFRILKEEHPRVGDRYEVWPTLDFESAIEDHILGVTHIIRGKDLMKSEKRQKFIYEYFGWKYPVTIHWGKIKVHEFGKFSTSWIREGIERGVFEGWDDPRLPTIKALRKRGFQPEAIRKFLLDIGISQNDIAVSMKNLYAENRKIVDAKASRYFFVRNPRVLRIEGDVPAVTRALKHPSGGDYREIKAGKEVYISEDDFLRLKEGDKMRLKFLCNVEVVEKSDLMAIARVVGEDIKKPIIHWVPKGGIKVRVKKPDGVDEGIGEELIASEVGKVVQFERYGFVRVDNVEGGCVIAYFTH
ncbi:MAG: glutamate--tRNA ligase [Candidatus Methanospirareceae archaeon]